MRVVLHRLGPHSYDAGGTFGYLVVLDEQGRNLFFAFTVELPWLGNTPEKSCIPVGEYPLEWEFSEHFGRNLWELKNVPGRGEAKIHPANRPHELLGCCGLGDAIAREQDGWYVINSRATVERFHAVLAGLTKTSITICQD